MAKYIDADKLAIDLQHRCDVVCPYTKAQRDVMCRACLLGDAIDTVEDQPAVDIPRWIPVTDRLPEEDKEVLISYRYKGGDTTHIDISITTYGAMYTGITRVKDWRPPFEYFHLNYEVIAWMPLPEPYKEGEQNG